MRPDTHEEFAVRLLTLAPEVTYTGAFKVRDYSLAIWIGRLYGYNYPDIYRQWSLGRSYSGYVVTFTRNDDPAARRTAEWMRNPNGDPTLEPPITWTIDGGPGFHPPGWLPQVRMVITRAMEFELRRFDQHIEHTLDFGWHGSLLPHKSDPLPPGPIPPLPPPPPSTIAYPNER